MYKGLPGLVHSVGWSYHVEAWELIVAIVGSLNTTGQSPWTTEFIFNPSYQVLGWQGNRGWGKEKQQQISEHKQQHQQPKIATSGMQQLLLPDLLKCNSVGRSVLYRLWKPRGALLPLMIGELEISSGEAVVFNFKKGGLNKANNPTTSEWPGQQMCPTPSFTKATPE